MKYVSTRGSAPVLGFGDVLLTGLASDGGLYVPDEWPRLPVADVSAWADRPYREIAVDVMAPFVEGDLDRDELAALVDRAYGASFDDPEVTPIRALDEDAGLWLMELFHGPTLAFKDVALQLVGPLFERELARRGDTVTIIGATSGDTGSAAIEALRDREGVEVVILHPEGRVSELQRRQMTTVDAANVHNLAVQGTFDDCQDLVKALFADESLRGSARLSAVNSMNWARVMAQIVYYVVAAARLARPSVAVSVPSGNFGNLFAGWVARRMGAPLSQLVCASNTNDILTRFFTTGVYERGEVVPTLSPSMDIQVSSNLERLLFELHGRDGEAVAGLLTAFREDGRVEVPMTRLGEVAEVFAAGSIDDEATTATIGEWFARSGLVLDPHTAVGVAVGTAVRRDPLVPMVCLATAHPAKFPDAVAAATGLPVELPERLARLVDLPERYEVVPNDLAAVRERVAAVAARMDR